MVIMKSRVISNRYFVPVLAASFIALSLLSFNGCRLRAKNGANVANGSTQKATTFFSSDLDTASTIYTRAFLSPPERRQLLIDKVGMLGSIVEGYLRIYGKSAPPAKKGFLQSASIHLLSIKGRIGAAGRRWENISGRIEREVDTIANSLGIYSNFIETVYEAKLESVNSTIERLDGAIPSATLERISRLISTAEEASLDLLSEETGYVQNMVKACLILDYVGQLLEQIESAGLPPAGKTK